MRLIKIRRFGRGQLVRKHLAEDGGLAWPLWLATISLVGCAAVATPLGTDALQKALPADKSIVIVAYKTEAAGLPVGGYWWMQFAVANESTGWAFRPLVEGEMFKTTSNRLDVIRPVEGGTVGWVVFGASTGKNYIAVDNTEMRESSSLFSLTLLPWDHYAVTSHPDQITLTYLGKNKCAHKDCKDLPTMDFIDSPRFGTDVPVQRSLIYAGTIVISLSCNDAKQPLSTCPINLTIEDESPLAHEFLARYRSSFPISSPMVTQLLTIPQSRTIEVRHTKPSSITH